MSKNRGRARVKKNKFFVGKQAKEVITELEEDNPIIKAFQTYANELDEKHDRYENIVKLSRDITIESKRIIFLLHNINTDIESKKESTLEEADKRLKSLCKYNFKSIAKELKGQDAYLYHRAYTSGMQEFIEALSFYQFLKNDSLETWNEANVNFQYDEDNINFPLLFTQYDFIMGIADFTGELMRKCINSLGSGNINDCFKLSNFVRAINTGFLGLIYSGNRELSRKGFTLKQSLNKMELVCYNIQIRGSEIPKDMLLNVIESQDMGSDIDEGFPM